MSDDNPLPMEDPEDRWPKDGDRLFVSSDWAYDAHLVSDPDERHYRMPMGYKRAGDLLIDRAAADVCDRPNIIYAALFCYRQCIELFLKQLIDEFGAQEYSLKNTHDLSCLWERFMDMINERGRGQTIGLSAVRELVAEMHDADKKSDGFRFPTDVKGVPFAFGDRSINLTAIRDVMNGLENFFECAHMDLSHEDDAAQLW